MVAWKSDTVFTIRDEAVFCSQVLLEHFNHTNMKSFVRQLNMYDFHKCSNKFTEKHEYAHPMFKRG